MDQDGERGGGGGRGMDDERGDVLVGGWVAIDELWGESV